MPKRPTKPKAKPPVQPKPKAKPPVQPKPDATPDPAAQVRGGDLPRDRERT